jgi:hypothetical protein
MMRRPPDCLDQGPWLGPAMAVQDRKFDVVVQRSTMTVNPQRLQPTKIKLKECRPGVLEATRRRSSKKASLAPPSWVRPTHSSPTASC